MIITPYTYTLSSADIVVIRSLGYLITSDSATPETFVNNHFVNFDLRTLLTKIDSLLAPIYKNRINKELSLVTGIPPELSFQIYSDDYDDPDNGLALCRQFSFEGADLVVYHAFFRLPKEVRGLGISKLVSQTLLQQYVNMGVSKIRVYAALNDGGYVWAKNYFTADNKTEVEEILGNAQAILNSREFDIVKRICDNYYIKHADGKAFPMNKWAELPFMKDVMRGSQWHGTIDLKNPEQFNNFTRYVTR